MEQLILHLLGDYVFQSAWQAQDKLSSWKVAFIHATLYSALFLLISSWEAWLVIWSTHMVMDRFGLAKYLVWLKNIVFSPHIFTGFNNPTRDPQWETKAWIGSTLFYYGFNPPEELQWENCKDNGGNPPNCPAYMSRWLTIAADNTVHLTINYLAIKYL